MVHFLLLPHFFAQKWNSNLPTTTTKERDFDECFGYWRRRFWFLIFRESRCIMMKGLSIFIEKKRIMWPLQMPLSIKVSSTILGFIWLSFSFPWPSHLKTRYLWYSKVVRLWFWASPLFLWKTWRKKYCFRRLKKVQTEILRERDIISSEWLRWILPTSTCTQAHQIQKTKIKGY